MDYDLLLKLALLDFLDELLVVPYAHGGALDMFSDDARYGVKTGDLTHGVAASAFAAGKRA